EACSLLETQIDAFQYADQFIGNSKLIRSYNDLNDAITSIKGLHHKFILFTFQALPRVYYDGGIGVLSQKLKSREEMEMLLYLTKFLQELTNTLLMGACVDIEKMIYILKRNLTRPAFVISGSNFLDEEKRTFVYKCLHLDDYCADLLVVQDGETARITSTCLEYQMLVKRLENYSKTLAWHIKRRDPKQCQAALLKLHLRCSGVDGGAEKALNCSELSNNCHNLVDICLGPVDSYSEGTYFHAGMLENVTKQLQVLYDPASQMNFMNSSVGAITMENILVLSEDCEMLRGDVETSDVLESMKLELEFFKDAVRHNSKISTAKQAEAQNILLKMRLPLERVRKTMKKIEQRAEFVDDQICKLCSKPSQSSEFSKNLAKKESNDGRFVRNDDPDQYRVKSGERIEAHRNVSSAYHAAQNPERRIFDVLLHGSGYEPDLPESPLLTTEPKLAGPELDSQTSATHLQMAI
uniref:PCI domain-containing protein n=1 Tax=Mesocestoides corti TaxID=53468 RepID=A0A5K3EW35_MESCO